MRCPFSARWQASIVWGFCASPNKMTNVQAPGASRTPEWGPHLPEASACLSPSASLIREDRKMANGTLSVSVS